jgi:thiamine-monophosphate kinase
MTCPGNSPGEGYSEREIIALLARRFRPGGDAVVAGIGDDAAVLRVPGDPEMFQIVTTDLLVEGIHFDRRYMSLEDIGYKALAVNLSDIAAMGADPQAAFGCLGLPPGFSKGDADSLVDGVAAACEESGAALAGGDTVGAHQLVIGFTVLGRTTGRPLMRSGARPGDDVWHSGGLGLSEAGFQLLSRGLDCPGELAAAHRRPRAQLELGRWLQREGIASACIDLSDSLSKCALQLAGASDAGLELDFQGYEFHPALREAIADPLRELGGHDTLAGFVLASSEDYQLLFTAAAEFRERITAEAPGEPRLLGVVPERPAGCRFRDERGTSHELNEIGWEHPR